MSEGEQTLEAPEHKGAWRVSPGEALRMLDRCNLNELRGLPIGNPMLALVPIVHHLLDEIDLLRERLATAEGKLIPSLNAS